MQILGYFATFVMGTSFGLIGAGGSILMVPILFYLFRQNALEATTNSLFVVGVTALIGAWVKAKSGEIDLKIGFFFAMPSFAGIFLARQWILSSLPNSLVHMFGFTFTKSVFVMTAFAIVMLFSAWAMIRSVKAEKVKAPSFKTLSTNFWSIGLKGLIVGVITGLVGAGGGFLIIPALVFLLKFPLSLAIGTSLAIVSVNSLFGFAISLSSLQTTDFPFLFGITILGIGGMFLGQMLSAKIQERYLKKGFGYFVLTVASLILLDQGSRL